MDLVDQNILWNITQHTGSACDAANNFSSLPIPSPLSQSSNFSMDSGFTDASGSSPTQTSSHPTVYHQQTQSVGLSTVNNQMQTFNNVNYTDDPFQQFYNSPISQAPVTITYPPYVSPAAVVPSNMYQNLVNVNPRSPSSPHLEIVEQPTDKPFRFRYKSEMHGTHGSLMGINNKRARRTFPTVALKNFDFNSVTPKAVIRCSLYQIAKENTDRFPHSHKLVIRRGDVEQNDPHDIEVSSQNDFTAVFQGMGIIHTKRPKIKEELFKKIRIEREFVENRQLNDEELKAIEKNLDDQAKAMNLNQVCLCFQAYIKNEVENTWVKLCEPVYSNVINNMKSALVGELRITRMSTYVSPASGGQEVFMFVEKVCKANIKVRFYELREDGSVEWEKFGIFNESDVHHQYGIVLRTPPYKSKSIETPVTVKVQLYRSSDACVSESLDFRYKPDPCIGGKRKRTNSNASVLSNIPTVVRSHETSSQGSASNPSNNGNQSLGSSQSFNGKFSQNSGAQQCHFAEQSLFHNTLPSYFGTFKPQDLNIALDDFCEFNCDSEVFQNVFDFDVNDASKLQQDSVSIRRPQEGQDFSAGPQPGLNCSLLDKFKMTIKLFKNNFDERKIHEMMISLIAAQNENDENFLFDYVEHGTLEDIKDLVLILVKYKLVNVLSSKNDLDQNCLHLLIPAGHSNLLRVFIHLGVDINQADAFGQTPLHVAVINESYDSLIELLDGSTTIKLNEANDDGFTPLQLAVRNNDLPIVKLLIEAGANIKTKSPTSGDNVLHMAVVEDEINMELIKFLIENEESALYQENHSGLNVLQVATISAAPEGLIQYLSGYYEELYMKIDDGTTTDSDTDEVAKKPKSELFDEQCLASLCQIFDNEQKWEGLATVMQLNEDKISEWTKHPSPSKCLFQYLEKTKKSLDYVIGILDMLDERRAINEIDEMVVRRFENMKVE